MMRKERASPGKVAGAKNSSKVKVAKENGKARTRMASVAATVDELPVEQPKNKEKNCNAKLDCLNSLNRNYHAYLNSQSPKFASVRDFVRKSAEFDLANEKLDAANADLATAQSFFFQAEDGIRDA